MKRRQFIADSVRLALGTRAAVSMSGMISPMALAGTIGKTFNDHEARTLFVLVHAMFPHRDLDDSYYLDVVAHLDTQTSASARFSGLIRTGIQTLDETAGGSWVDATPERKLQILTALQEEEFFGVILNRAIDVLYRNQEVLTRLGYQGSSIEFGGYLHRGFDDIGWLPE